MSELRWHPLLREWVITATERQERSLLPSREQCPLCPGADTEAPESPFDVVVFDNRFPSLRRKPPVPAVEGTPLSPVAPAAGACEVVIYTRDHDTHLSERSQEEIEQLIWVWRHRYREHSFRPEVRYVYIFENRGEEIGVTQHHPHGQIYSFPFIPPRQERELESIALHRAATGRCLVCDAVELEMASSREVAQGAHFYAGIPFYARWPYETHIWSRRHAASLLELTAEEVTDLAAVLRTVLRAYDELWQKPMCFMMVIKQLPVDGRPLEADHLRIEFYPPRRSEHRLKYLAAVETGAGCFINDTLAEEKSAELRAAAQRVLQREGV